MVFHGRIIVKAYFIDLLYGHSIYCFYGEWLIIKVHKKARKPDPSGKTSALS